jgi:hypothetical protein
MSDGGTSVVVKAGEEFEVEADVAAKLLSTTTSGNSGKWSAAPPEARPADAAESQRIHARASELMKTSLNNVRTKTFLDNLKAHKGVMVYGYAKGRDVSDVIAENKQTGKGLFGKRKMREGSIFRRIMTDPDLVSMFGRASAADIVLGNSDRFVGKVNFSNVMIDEASNRISLIDNVEATDAAVLRDIPGTNGRRGFDIWTLNQWPKLLAAQNYKKVAESFTERIEDKLMLNDPDVQLRAVDRKALRQSLRKHREAMNRWFAAGLAAGTKAARQAVLHNVRGLTATVDTATRKQVAANLLARGYFLEGEGAGQAWDDGEEMAILLIRTSMPALPQLPTNPRS